MYTIAKNDDKFQLLKDGVFVGEYVSLEAAEKAQTEAEDSDSRAAQRLVDDARILRTPEQIDADYKRCGSSELLVKKLTGEDRFDAFLRWLEGNHGFHVPDEIKPKE